MISNATHLGENMISNQECLPCCVYAITREVEAAAAAINIITEEGWKIISLITITINTLFCYSHQHYQHNAINNSKPKMNVNVNVLHEWHQRLYMPIP